ncbi:MAG: 30S ribosome-binding factor RbfA [Sutterellaceae bacterium]|nr:30S ribosome-binding factor RbfA [Sutterellaceae bacterium]MDD7441461.1 30S ribosome-binding factor RbfA [Sutterellaceae bacterium]MDY2868773.1 30S ribosome-binding factor RbfA [Mesosutterella sp.]
MRKAKPGRSTRIADQIARDVAELIPKEVRDPRVGFVTVTGCDITPDYAHANIYFTVIGADPEECREGLNAAAGMLRNLIFRKLRIHTVPTLHFVHDESVDRGFAMDKLIAEALDKKPGE